MAWAAVLLGGGSVVFNVFLIVSGDSVFVFVLLCITLLVGWLVLLLYVPSQQLWSLRDGQFT